MSNFGVGDVITLNVPGHPMWHGKSGKIIDRIGTSFKVSIIDSDGRETLTSALASQMIKVIRDPALAKFIDETLPELTQAAVAEHNSDQDKLVEEANRDIKAYKAGMTAGYLEGFREGYFKGYSAACDDIQRLFIESGLVPPLPGDQLDQT